MFRLLSTLFVIVSTYAYRQDLAKLPNGNSYGLTLGHPGGATARTTKIASSFYGMGQTWNKAFCMADADGDGQSNGLEMGDPCCKWSIGQAPQFTTGLSDPNSAASTTMNKMPPCIMANTKRSDVGNPGPGVCACNGNIFDVGSCDSADCYNLCDKRGLGHGVCTTKFKANANANAKLQCTVCVQALQLDLAKPSDNAAEFSLTSVKSCKDATQDDAQKLLCVAALIKNADQLLMDQQNGVTPMQSCMNLGLLCTPTTPPTAAPTTTPSGAPTSTPSGAPTSAPPTVAPTAVPTKAPTPPPPPRTNSMLSVPCPIENGTACTTLQTFAVVPSTETTETSIMIPVVVSVAGSVAGVLVLSFAMWSYHKNKKAQLEVNDNDFHAMPDITYSH
jgi:hypothetical protein